MKAYGYLRVSGKSQLDGDGFDRQKEEIERYAKKAGIELVDWYEEKAISGTTDENERPAFQEMISAILKNGVRTIIIEGMDRLSREYRIQESLLIYLASKGISLHSARTEQDVTAEVMSDPMRKALVQMQGVFAELEKSMLVKKLRTAREHKKEKTGKCEGRKSWTESNPELIREIKKLRRKKKGHENLMSWSKVANELNRMGYRNQSGNDFTGTAISKIYQRA